MKRKRIKVYIAGKISGLDYQDAVANFHLYANLARLEFGNDIFVVLPTSICPIHWGWWKCMLVCLKAMLSCDIAYFMPNWRDSKGARIEHFVAQLFGIKTIVK